MVRKSAFFLVMSAAALAAACAAPSIQQVRLDEDLRVKDSKFLRGALRAESPLLRARAARAMGRVQDPDFAPLLGAALQDSATAVRIEAAFALGQLRIDDPAPAPRGFNAPLIRALADSQAPVRAAALEALGKSGGTETERRIRAFLRDPAPEIRREAAAGLFRLRYLKRIPEYSTATVRALARGIYDKDAEMRWRSAYAFSRWPEPRALKSLVRATRQRNRWVRLFALRSLAQLGAKAPVDTGQQALKDKDYKIRAQAAALLGKAGRADLIPAEIAEDKSAHVRAAAADALAGAKGDMSLLAKLAEDASPLVRGAAILSLAKRRRDGYTIDLESHAKDTHWWVRSRAMLGAAGLKRAAFRILEIGLADEDVRVRAAAVSALGARRGGKVLRAIAKILNDPGAALELRGAAVEAAGRRKTLLLLEPLEQAYENSLNRSFVKVREGVVDAASALAKAHPKDPRTAAFRRKLLADPAPSVRAKAARALGLKTEPAPPPPASPFLLEIPAKEKSVVLETDKGKVVIELFCEDAPIHCANILSLARKGTYDGTPFHRVVTNFIVQGGDPRGTGWGDAGYSLRDEINRRRFGRGTLGMPKAGKDTGGAQLFITHVPTPHLDGRYTVFGKVVLGMYIVDRLEPGDLIRKAYPR